MKLIGAGFCHNFNHCRARLRVLRAVIRSRYFEFSDGVQTGVDLKRIAPGTLVNVINPVNLPVVHISRQTVDWKSIGGEITYGIGIKAAAKGRRSRDE